MSDRSDCGCDQALALKEQLDHARVALREHRWERDEARAQLANEQQLLREANQRCNDAWRDLEASKAKAKDLDTHVGLLREQLATALTERDTLGREFRRYRSETGERAELKAERDALRTEVERLREVERHYGVLCQMDKDVEAEVRAECDAERDHLRTEVEFLQMNLRNLRAATDLPCGHGGEHRIEGDDGPCLACYAESK